VNDHVNGPENGHVTVNVHGAHAFQIHDLIQDSCCWIEDSEKRDFAAVLGRVYVVFDVAVVVAVGGDYDPAVGGDDAVGAHRLHHE
jgi:hypothetical protein